MPRRTPYERFMAKVKIDPETGCWIWTGATHTQGYGAFWYESKNRLAHRVSYEMHIGPIPEGLQIDHLCRVRKCVNALHLEPVEQWENIRRGIGFAAMNSRKTHCLRGHEFTPENTYVPIRNGRKGERSCRPCRRMEQAARRARLKEMHNES